MNKLLLTICAASVATASVAATIDLRPAQLQRTLPASAADFSAIYAPAQASTFKAPTRAEEAGAMETLDFSLAFEPYSALTFGENAVGLEIYQAAVISPELATLYAGAKVTSINVCSGTNKKTNLNGIKDIKVFLKDGLEEDPFLEQAGQLGTAPFEYNKITLDEPYTIEAGKGFVVGYTCTPVSKNDYYITIDGVARENSDGCYIGVKEKGQIQWMPYSTQVGYLCIGMTLESDNFPQDAINIFQVDAPTFTPLGKAFSADLYLVGGAINGAESVEVEYTVGTAEPQTLTWTFNQPLGYNQVAVGTLENIVCNEVGTDIPFSVRITKVNGKPNTGLTPEYTATLSCIDPKDGFKRNFVAEEGTGTWCGWCPAGIVFMEYLKENYPEDFIRVAVHGNDPMQANSASSLLNYFSGFPMVIINRSVSMSPTAENVLSDLDAYYETVSAEPALAEISDISVSFSDGNEIEISAKTQFALDIKNDDYRYGLSFCITRDGMGPYRQTNYYSGSSTVMGGWEKRAESVMTKYDDVLRELCGGVTGYTDAFPEEIKGHTEYEFSDFASLRNVNCSEFYVTAMITDNNTGEILNAKQVTVIDSGVETIGGNAAVKVAGGEGKVVIAGQYDAATVYDFGGVKVAEATGEAEIALPAGLYIVSVDGEAVKVAVK